MSAVEDEGLVVEAGLAKGFWRDLAIGVLRRPSLWITAGVQAVDFAPLGWWRRKPFLPLPDAKYLEFRLETQYGLTGTPEAAHVIEYLEWCRSMRKLRSSAH